MLLSNIIYREEAVEQYKADLSKIYKSKQEFYDDLNKLKKEYAKELLPYKGRLNNIQILKEYLLKDTYYEQIIKKLGFYSHILKDLEGDKILFRDFQDFVNSNEYMFFC